MTELNYDYERHETLLNKWHIQQKQNIKNDAALRPFSPMNISLFDSMNWKSHHNTHTSHVVILLKEVVTTLPTLFLLLLLQSGSGQHLVSNLFVTSFYFWN